MRRLTVLAVIVAVFALPLTAQAAHCVNVSKKADAGNGVIILIDLTDDTVTISGHGGFGNVWLDFDGDGEGDLLATEGVQIGKNHSTVAQLGDTFSAELEPWVNPGAINKVIKGLVDHGMAFASE